MHRRWDPLEATRRADMRARLHDQERQRLASRGYAVSSPTRSSEAAAQVAGRALSSEPDSFDASRECVARMRNALLALPDDAPGQPRFVEKYASDNSLVLHGTTSCIPHGLTRSMEAEFKDNDRDEGATEGKWWPNYRYVVYETAVEEAIQSMTSRPSTRATRAVLVGASRTLLRRRRRAARISARPRSPPCACTRPIGSRP